MKILNKYIFIIYCLFSILVSVNHSYAADNSKWLSINKKGKLIPMNPVES